MYTIQIREVRTGEISFETLEEAKQWHENREGDVYWYYNDEKCKLEKTNLNYLFKNSGGYSMDSKTKPIWWDDKMESRFKNIWSEEYDGLLKEEIRNKIIHRCEILKYMGDDGVHPLYYQLNDKELVEDCGWVLEEGCDFCDKYELGLTER